MNKKEIQFIGKITAGVTHEINNALASIKEISGLLEDLISLTSDESFPNIEKFINVLPKIQEQVKRGVTLTTRLNKFSHLTDKPKAEVELNEFLELLIFLTERFARIRNIELSFVASDKLIQVSTMPVLLQMAVYNCVAYLYNNGSAGGKVTVQPALDDEQYSITVKYDGEIPNNKKLFDDSSFAEELKILEETISELEGSIQKNTNTNTFILSIKINQRENITQGKGE